jgi:lysophospholipase L1-like esterase
MRGIARLLILPIHSAWVAIRSLRFSDVPRPMDVPHVHAGTTAGDRILLIGDGLAIGWGVATHELGLAGAMARALAVRTGAGVDVDLVTGVQFPAATLHERLAAFTLRRYDSIVLSLGVGDALALSAIPAWGAQQKRNLDELRARSTPTTQIFVLGIFPIAHITEFAGVFGSVADRHALAFDDELARMCAAMPHTHFISLRQSAERLGMPRHAVGYRNWAAALVDHIGPVVAAAAPINHELELSPLELADRERSRQAAVDALRTAAPDAHSSLQSLVDSARRIFNTSAAAVTIIDRDNQHYRAHTGAPHDDIARVDSFCTVTVSHAGALVVADATSDERFKHLGVVQGVDHTRFYAGFPIESPTGERVGALCVLDDRPRSTADFDVSLLRELALIAQRELWPEGPGVAA